jgi:hypothetical protein
MKGSGPVQIMTDLDPGGPKTRIQIYCLSDTYVYLTLTLALCFKTQCTISAPFADGEGLKLPSPKGPRYKKSKKWVDLKVWWQDATLFVYFDCL